MLRLRVAASAFVCVVSAVLAAEPPTAEMLALGIRQFRDGDLEAAVFTLDSVIRRLSGRHEHTEDLVRAYVHMGAAYVGLEHEEAAKGKFREALRLRPGLRLSSEQFSSRVIKVFETQVLKRAAARQRRGAKVLMVVGGAGAAAAVGIAAATGGPSNRPPTASFSISPDGKAIVQVTNVSFTVAATDPDFDTLSYRWDFGDGATASGPTVAHAYGSTGTFRVVVLVDDGRGGSVTAGGSVTVASLSGTWTDGTSVSPQGGARLYQWTQAGGSLTGASLVDATTLRGTLSSPRSAVLEISYPPGSRTDTFSTCTGEFDKDLNELRCVSGARVDSWTRR